MAHYEIIFPCGLKIKQGSVLWYFGDNDWDALQEYGCPIHGKKCRKNIR